MQSKAPIVICLMGPTASGKTDLAVNLSEHFASEIINVDSAQIYQGMDIGSGKPSLQIRQKVPHHLMDFLDPKIPYNAAQFRHDAIACINEILERGKVPILVGGTMLYFKVLQQGLSSLPEANDALRKRLEAWADREGWAALHKALYQIDPLTANRIKPNDSQRIQRALEIAEITGKPMSFWLSQPKADPLPFEFLNIALIPVTTPRAVLHERILLRFDAMLENGLVAEVEKLFRRGDLNDSLPAIRSVGYRQVWQYLMGQLSYDEMHEKAVAATRQLAKRQLTWLRQWPMLTTFDFLAPGLSESVLDFLKKHGVMLTASPHL